MVTAFWQRAMRALGRDVVTEVTTVVTPEGQQQGQKLQSFFVDGSAKHTVQHLCGRKGIKYKTCSSISSALNKKLNELLSYCKLI